jgi:predicted MFS family arabinose efflux permease
MTGRVAVVTQRGTEQQEVGAERARWAGAAGVATAAMAAAMLPLYAVSALGPALVGDLRLPRSAVGVLVTSTFSVACVASVVAGKVVDAHGPRRGLLGLAGLVLAGMGAAALAPGYGWLLVALAGAGVAQALANPATNLLVVTRVPAPRRALAIGVKQSGVQFAAFAAGLALPPLAAVAGWRAGMAVAAVLPAVLGVVVWWRVPPAAAERVVSGPMSARTTGSAPRPRWVIGLMGFSLLLGTGLAVVNTYLPLYASQQLSLPGTAAGSALAAFGVAGLLARVVWTRVADRLSDLTVALLWLSLAAGGAALLLPLAVGSGAWLVWVGAIGVGATATGANAVSMLVVVRRGGATGHASALVSLGFFGGFVIGPTGVGVLADHAGWSAAWLAVAVVFGGAAVAARLVRV